MLTFVDYQLFNYIGGAPNVIVDPTPTSKPTPKKDAGILD